ncbi:MAG TPA: glycosyltransferase [Kofleriaceae bacterium]
MSNGSTVALSVVIPAYNEEARLPRTLTETLSFLALRDDDNEVIVIDDGSRDRTAAVVTEFAKLSGGRVRLLANPGNRGKGFAVRHGVMNARGEVVLFYDADLSTPLHEVEKVIRPILDDRCDVVIGSRSGAQRATQPRLRRMMASQFRWLRQRLVGLDFHDTQCGFKALRRDAAHAIFGHQTVNGFAFDVEILMIARAQHWRIRETEVEWTNQPGSTIDPVRSSLAMLRELVLLRLNRPVRRSRTVLQAAVRLVAPDGTAQDSFMENVHRDGMFVRTWKKLAVGDRVTILLPLPEGTLLTLYARVAHTSSLPRRGIGVAFVDLDARTLASLDAVLARLEGKP